MVAILENPEVRHLVKLTSVDEYAKSGERADGTRTELIRGIIIEKMPPSPPHTFITEQLREMVQEAAAGVVLPPRATAEAG